jgi:hypothetical protein
MATQKSTQVAPAASVTSSTDDAGIDKLRECITYADSYCQSAQRTISAATAAILMMLREPDSPGLRMQIKALCVAIDYQATDCMNAVNVSAEEHGAHWIDQRDRDNDTLICAAANRPHRANQVEQAS